MSGSPFADGVEFEETFQDAAEGSSVSQEPAPQVVQTTELPTFDAPEAAYQQMLERRLSEAETMVKDTIARMRLDEEQRLEEWVQLRRADEEHRLARWAEERRAAIERSIQQRIEQRRADELRIAEQRRQSDGERLQRWRAELEQALSDGIAPRRSAAGTERPGELHESLGDAVAATTSARSLGRVLREAVAEVTPTSAFALSVHHQDRDEVAYRYRVASDDELGTLLRGEALEDGPQSAASHTDGWVRSEHTVRVGSREVTVHTAQGSVRSDGATVGVLTLQTADQAIDDAVLAQVDVLIAACAGHLSALRDNGSYRSV